MGNGSLDAMFWSARTGDDLTLPGGYFIGPSTPTDITARWGSFDRPTATLLGKIADTGALPAITEQDRRQAVVDLRYWRGSVVVLAPVAHETELHLAVDSLLGPGQRIGGAWVWDVRPLVG
jgi:hypothetical protein